MIRAFYGIPIDATIIERLQKDLLFQLQSTEDETARIIDEKLWHITIKFFDSITPERLETVSEMFKEVVSQVKAFRLKIKKIAKFPTTSSHIVAAFVKPQQTLREFHKFLDKAGEKMGLRREMRRYKPHITLAKFKSDCNVFEAVKYHDFILPVQELVLYESRPKEQGSHYIPLHRFKLLE